MRESFSAPYTGESHLRLQALIGTGDARRVTSGEIALVKVVLMRFRAVRRKRSGRHRVGLAEAGHTVLADAPIVLADRWTCSGMTVRPSLSRDAVAGKCPTPPTALNLQGQGGQD